MPPSKQGKSELVITIDNASLNVDLELRSLPHLRVSFIGACTMAQNLIIKMLDQDGSTSQPRLSQPREDIAIPRENQYTKKEEQVSKEKALEHYTAEMLVLQHRIKTISESDDRATFYISLPSPNVK